MLELDHSQHSWPDSVIPNFSSQLQNPLGSSLTQNIHADSFISRSISQTNYKATSASNTDANQGVPSTPVAAATNQECDTTNRTEQAGPSNLPSIAPTAMMSPSASNDPVRTKSGRVVKKPDKLNL
jgi:hypothetical protein